MCIQRHQIARKHLLKLQGNLLRRHPRLRSTLVPSKSPSSRTRGKSSLCHARRLHHRIVYCCLCCAKHLQEKISKFLHIILSKCSTPMCHDTCKCVSLILRQICQAYKNQCWKIIPQWECLSLLCSPCVVQLHKDLSWHLFFPKHIDMWGCTPGVAAAIPARCWSLDLEWGPMSLLAISWNLVIHRCKSIVPLLSFMNCMKRYKNTAWAPLMTCGRRNLLK